MPTLRKLIAVIDDDPSIRNALSRQMRAAGFRTAAFQCAEEFLLAAATCGAAMVISDIHLGELSGLDLAVHPQVVQMQLPVVLISGSIDPEITARAQDVAAAFLRKPIPPGMLLETVIDTVGAPIAGTED
ncbi:MAG TPA: response regulator [Steroidobacteraceae bacterium]|jgi:FixJ family two-component response regulator|nr:response regulator [Steroidobacteraceae bacterium]